MTKYNPDTVKKFMSSIEAKTGRVRACKNANIDYQTFLDWINPEHSNHRVEFLELLKKTEAMVASENEDYAVLCIISKMKEQWPAAAWWLERTNPEKYGRRDAYNVDAVVRGQSVPPLLIIKSGDETTTP